MSGTLNLSKLAAMWESAPASPLDAALAERRQRGETCIDLITTNPHEHQLNFPTEILRRAVDAALPAIHVYRPDPLGALEAREALAAYYRRRGTPANAARLCLAPGTSLAYFYALRLLLNRGDEVLIPSPGYPLFDDLCAVAGVAHRKHHLKKETEGWAIDVDEMEFQCTPRTRAVIVVSPHNPTGAMPDAAHWRALGDLCRRRGLTLIVDEVFCEYVDPAGGTYVRPHAGDFPLLITLNGFSKMFSLPGWKIGWLKADGDNAPIASFMAALEHISDTFLPVPDLQQAMIRPLLESGEEVLADLNLKIADRRILAMELLRAKGWVVDPSPAGVYICVQLPEGVSGETFALRALQDCGVLVHPGYFYDLPHHWVMTCIAGEATLREGIDRLDPMKNDHLWYHPVST